MTPQRNTPSILFRFIACSPYGRPNRIKFAALLALGLVVCLSPSARAATASWVGGASANWAGANWSGGAGVGGAPAPDVTGTDALLFGAAGASGTTLVDNLMTPSTYTVSGITFNSSAPGYLINSGTVGTNGFTLNGGITNSSGNLQTINDLITLSGVQTFTAGTGGLTFGGSVNGTGGVTTAAGGVVTFLGAQSYTGGVNVVANSTLVLGSTNGANTESGGLTLSGTLQLQANSSNGGNLMAGSDQVTWSAGGTLQLRGTNNASFAGSSGGTINTVSGNYNIDVNNLNGVGGNNTLTLNFYPGSTTKLGFVSYNSSNSNSVFNITGGNGDILDINGIGTGVASTITLNPTSASLILGEYYSNHTGASNLVMEGTATGNSVGFINAEYTGVTVTKENTSTWTISGAAGTGGNITSTTIDNGGGILAINNATALGTSPVTIETSGANSTGVLQVNVSGGTLAAPNAITIGAVTLYGQTGSLATSGTSDLENVTGFNSIASNITLSSAGGASSAYSIITSDAGNLNLSGNLTTSSVTAGEGTTFDFGGAGNGTVAGNIVDGSTIHVAVRKDGAGKWTLSGANTYSAGTTIDPNGGTLEAASAGSLPSYGTAGKVIVGGTSTLALNYGGASDWTSAQVTSLLAANGSNFANGSYLAFDTTNGTGAYSGNITGNMGLIKIGANILTLSGTNTYAGTTTVNAGSGTLEVTSTAALQGYATAGEVTVGTASTLAVNYGGPSDWTNAQMITLLANANFASGSLLGFDTTNGSGTYANNISGSYGINKLGINTLTLTAANGYTGPTTVTSGTLALTGAGTLGAGSGALTMSGGTLDLGGASLTAGAVSITAAPAGSNTIQTGTLTGSSYAASNTTGNAIVTASLLGSGIALGKTGAGTLTLSGADTFTGATSISGGIVNYQNGTAFGTDSAITVSSGATAQVQGGITGGNLTLTIAGAGATGATGALENVSGNNNYGGAVALTGAATISSDSGLLSLTNTGTIVGSGDALTLTGSGNGSISGIIGTVAGSLTKSGTGTWTLSGANTYTGGSTISAGTLALKATAAGGTYNISSGAILDFATGSALNAGATTTFTGAGTLEIQSGLIFGQNQTDTVNLSAGGLILVTGNDNATGSSSNKGIWNTNQGSLEVDAGSTLNFVEAGSAHAVSVDALNGGGTITAGYTGDPVTMTIGVASGSGTFSGVLENNPSNPTTELLAITKTGTGTEVFSGANTYTNPTTLYAGILEYENGTAFGANSAITITSGSSATVQVQGGITGGNDTLTINGAGAANATGALENVSGNNSYGGLLALNGAATISSDAGTLSLTNAGTIAGSGDNLTLTGAGNGSIAGIIGTVAGKVTKSGAGTWALTGANTYTGTTTVNAGTLQLGSGGSLGGTAVTVGSASNATLQVNGAYTIGSAGTASLTLTGATGTLSLVDGTINTLTVGGAASALTLGGSDTIDLDVSGGSSDEILLAGTGKTASVTGTNTIDLSMLSIITSGTDVLISAAGGGLATSGTFVLGPTTGVFLGTSTLVDSSTAVLLVNVANAVPGTAYYTGTLGSAWNSISGSGTNGLANFTTDSAGGNNTNQLPGSTTNVHFYTTNANAGNLSSTLGQNFIVNSLTVDGTSIGAESTPVSIGGANSLTIMASGTNGITVGAGAGAVTVSAPLILGASQTWVNNSANSLSVSGSISGAFALSTSGTGTTVLSGNNSYNGGTSILGGTLTIGANNTLLTTGTLAFGSSAGAGTGALNLASFNQTVGALNSLSNSATANTVNIGAGETLTVSGTGGLNVGVDLSASSMSSVSYLSMAGGGSLVVANAAANVVVGVLQGNATYNNTSTLNLTGLGSVTLGNSTTAINQLEVGYGQTDAGTLLLSNTFNSITAGAIQVANSLGMNSAGFSEIVLGTGTNLLAANSINIASGTTSAVNKANGEILFASQTAGSPGSVTITNEAGTGGAIIDIGVRGGAAGTTSGPAGTLDLRGHLANVTASTVTVGSEDNTDATAGGSSTGTLYFDTGTFTATTLDIGYNASTANNDPGTGTVSIGGGTFAVTTVNMANKTGAGTGVASGTINVSGGSLTINTGGSFTLATEATGGTALGTLVITGGTVTSKVNILQGTGAGATGVITLNGGTLNMMGNNIGSAVTSVTTLNFQSGTLENVGSINGTAGVTKTTAGILTLAGNNSFTGQTAINAGTLDVSAVAAVGTAQPLGENATVSLGAATLAYLGTTGTLAQNVTLTGNGTISNGGGSTLTLSGTLTKLGDVLSLSGGAFDVTGPITGNSGSFNSDLDVVNGSSVTLSNANNNYYGPTVVSGSSTLQNGVANALPATTILTMGATFGLTSYTNTYDLNGYSQSIAGLASSGSGSQVVTDSAASTASTLTITGTTSTETYGGVIQNGSGNVALTVSGGSEVLNGANTYSGNTSVTGGTLTIGATGGLTSSTNLSVANGGTFAVNSGGSILSTTALTANGNVNLSNASQTLASLNGASTGVMTLNSTSLTVNNGGTFAGVIQDGASAGSLTVAGGTMALTGDNTFSGGATVSGGTLLVSGSLSGAGAVNVAGGALGGSGYIAGATTVGEAGTLAPAATLTGTAGIVLTIGNYVALNDGSTLVINIDANTNATDLLQITNSSALTLAGNDTLTVDLVNGSSLVNPLSGYEIASYSGMLSGVFANVNIPAGYVVDYGVTVANEITLQAQAIPEPGTWAMLLCGAGILLVRKRKRRQLN